MIKRAKNCQILSVLLYLFFYIYPGIIYPAVIVNSIVHPCQCQQAVRYLMCLMVSNLWNFEMAAIAGAACSACASADQKEKALPPEIFLVEIRAT